MESDESYDEEAINEIMADATKDILQLLEYKEKCEQLEERLLRRTETVKVRNGQLAELGEKYTKLEIENRQLKEDALLGKAFEYLFENYDAHLSVATGGFEGESEGFSISCKEQLINGYKQQVEKEGK